jgi:hypothetical protein
MRNMSLSERHTKKGDCQNSVNDHRWPEYPPDIAVIAEKALVGGVLHKPASQSAAREAPARKEYQGTGN